MAEPPPDPDIAQPDIKVLSGAFWAMMGLALASILGALALFGAIHHTGHHTGPHAGAGHAALRPPLATSPREAKSGQISPPDPNRAKPGPP